MYIVERLFSSSLVVVVSLSMPRRMNVYHFKKGTEICNYSYSNNILSVKLNRQVINQPSAVQSGRILLCATLMSSFLSQRLVVCLEESIYIHNIKDMKLLKTLLNTPTNPSGTLGSSAVSSNQAWVEVALGPWGALSDGEAAEFPQSSHLSFPIQHSISRSMGCPQWELSSHSYRLMLSLSSATLSVSE